MLFAKLMPPRTESNPCSKKNVGHILDTHENTNYIQATTAISYFVAIN
ncbi:hypothetical protein DSUL_50065 [Desulfovibrionales bacterium]